jgi:hypothetical protein
MQQPNLESADQYYLTLEREEGQEFGHDSGEGLNP